MCDTAPIRSEPSSYDVPVTTIRVMIASGREAPPAAWLHGLTHEDGIRTIDVPVTDPSRLAACMSRFLPDVLLLDSVWLHRADPSSLRSLHYQCAHVRVLLLSPAPYPGVAEEVLRNRFRGFLSTRCPLAVCVQAIRSVCRGELWLSRASLAEAVAGLLPPCALPVAPEEPGPLHDDAEMLTRREAQIVGFLRRGCTNKEIALELGIMEDTVKKHLQSVFAKLGVHRRALVALGRPRATA